MKRFFLLALLLVLVCLVYTPAFAGSQEITAKLQSGNYIQNANNLYIIFDRSGSMGDYYGKFRKIRSERLLVTSFNKTIPSVALAAAFRTFGGSLNDADFTETRRLYGLTNYSQAAVDKAIREATKYFPFGNTPLDGAITAAGNDLKIASGKIAVVIFSDGVDLDNAPVKAASGLKSQYGDRLCIYTVQIGNDENGTKVLQKIAEAGECGIFAKGDNLGTDAEMTSFVERIFLAAKPPEAAPKKVEAPEILPPTPTPVYIPPPPIIEKKPEAEAAPQVVEKLVQKEAPVAQKVTIALNVEFDTGKAVVKPKYYNEIKRVADFMKQYPDTNATIEGHTDNVGKVAANVALSQKRADAIAKILADKYGIGKSRIKAVGYGPNKPIASNSTAKGRQQNRRVQAQMETVVTK